MTSKKGRPVSGLPGGEPKEGGGGSKVLAWLLSGDVAVRYQTTRDLLGREEPGLRERIALEGHGAALLAARGPSGHWGRGYYQPKWTCTHYTLLELKNLGPLRSVPAARESVRRVLSEEKGADGAIDPSRTVRGGSDVCINGMALNFCSYFGAEAADLVSVVDFLLSQQLPDGGFNCQYGRTPTTHSSVHSTICVFEGIAEYLRCGHPHGRTELAEAARSCVEFFLRHRLFRSERSGAPMAGDFLRLHHPTRWHFDVLRCLDAFAAAGVPPDPRMGDAVDVLVARRRPDGRWAAARAYPGATHLPPVPAGSPDPWVTLAATRVLASYADAGARRHRPPETPVRNSTTSPSAMT